MFSSQNSGGCRCEFPVQRFKELVHRYDAVDKVAVGADKGQSRGSSLPLQAASSAAEIQ